MQEYLDQQYQYDAFRQLIRQKSSQGDLNLEWDVLGRLVRSRNNQYTADYRYDALVDVFKKEVSTIILDKSRTLFMVGMLIL